LPTNLYRESGARFIGTRGTVAETLAQGAELHIPSDDGAAYAYADYYNRVRTHVRSWPSLSSVAFITNTPGWLNW
jgi:hypothetical protein